MDNNLAPNSPSVSVVMPIYNGEKYLAAAVESVLSQSFQDLELICVNDGSLDATAEILAGIKDERVRVLRQLNRGSAAARNLGIQNARGKYVAFIDADDLWLPGKLEVQVPLLENHPEFGAVYSRCLAVDDAGKTLGCYPRDCRSGSGLLREFFLDDFIPMLTLMIRKNPLDRIGLFDDRILISEDFEFKARLVASEKIAFCSPPLAKYRKHRGQKTSMPDRIKEDLEIIENLVQRYIELRPLRNLKTAWAWSMTAKILSQKGDMTGARTCLLKAIRLQPYSISPYLRMIATLPGARLLVPILRSARDMWSRNQSRVWKDTVE